MSMSYKDDLNRLVEYLDKEQDSLVNDELWDKSSDELYEELEEYRRAIIGALDTIKYYEERETILKTQHGSEFIEKLDADWFALRKAFIDERFGIGFEQKKVQDIVQKVQDSEQKTQDSEQKEDDGHEISD